MNKGKMFYKNSYKHKEGTFKFQRDRLEKSQSCGVKNHLRVYVNYM